MDEWLSYISFKRVAKVENTSSYYCQWIAEWRNHMDEKNQNNDAPNGFVVNLKVTFFKLKEKEQIVCIHSYLLFAAKQTRRDVMRKTLLTNVESWRALEHICRAEVKQWEKCLHLHKSHQTVHVHKCSIKISTRRLLWPPLLIRGNINAEMVLEKSWCQFSGCSSNITTVHVLAMSIHHSWRRHWCLFLTMGRDGGHWIQLTAIVNSWVNSPISNYFTHIFTLIYLSCYF